MRALIVYESLYGNTHIIANSIAEGLRDKACDVTVVPVNRATAELVRETDLLVVGGPTHMHGMSSTSSRRMAVDAARKPGSGLTLEPVALGPGLREWLHGIGPGHGLAAAGVRHAIRGAGGVHRAREQRHRSPPAPARLPSRRLPGELPDQQAERTARAARRTGPRPGGLRWPSPHWPSRAERRAS